MNHIMDMAKAVVPDFPSDREVKGTRDVVAWYKIKHAERALLVPPINILKANMLELNKFIETVQAFAKHNFGSPLYEWDHLDLHSATGPTAAVALDDLHQMAAAGRCKIAADIETRRVEWEDNKLLAIGFAYNESSSLAVYDVFDNTLMNNEYRMLPEVKRALQDFLEDDQVSWGWHNGKFDCCRLSYLEGIRARVDWDTMLKHYVQINEKKGSHGLKDLGQLYLQAPPWDDELDALKKQYCKEHKCKLSDFMYDYIPTEVLIPYMQRDTIATYRLDDVFEKLRRPESDFIYGKLIEASNVYGQIELTGQRLDMDYLDDLEFDLDCQIKEAQTTLDGVAGAIWNAPLYARATGARTVPKEFNASSPKQLKWMLSEVLGYEPPSTNQVTMDNLLSDCESGHITNPLAKEFISFIMTVRKLEKYMSTYVQGMSEAVCRDLRIRCVFNLHGTETGRLSSSNPNMQNIPRNKMIKNLLIATPGYKLLQLDYSQAELRVLAMLSDDDALIQIYKDGRDLHDAVADMMFGEGGHQDKELRNLAKTINFGIVYGRGPSSIAEKFGKSMDEAKGIIAKWFAPMPKVKAFIEERKRMARKGEPCVTPVGRERHFVITNEEMYHIQNEYINTPIQSLASDFTMFAVLEIYKYLEELNASYGYEVARITTTVHDSIIIEVLEDDKVDFKGIARKGIAIMESIPLQFVPDCKVPFVADADMGYKWGEMEKCEL